MAPLQPVMQVPRGHPLLFGPELDFLPDRLNRRAFGPPRRRVADRLRPVQRDKPLDQHHRSPVILRPDRIKTGFGHRPHRPREPVLEPRQ